MIKKRSKKGEIAVGFIIALVLGILVLAFWIFLGTDTFKSARDSIFNLGGGEVNIGNVITGCNTACRFNLRSEWCDLKRKVVFQRGQDEQTVTCRSLALRGEVDCKTFTDADCKNPGGPTGCSKFGGEVIDKNECGDKRTTHGLIVYPILTSQNLICCVQRKNTCNDWGGRARVIDPNSKEGPCGTTTELDIRFLLLTAPDEKNVGDGLLANKACCIKKKDYT